MKKTLSLVLALLFVLALFAGCNNGGGGTPATQAPGNATQAPATKAPATQAPDDGGQPAATQEPEPVVDEGPYHYAAGKYAMNDEGFPVEKYVYDKPITENDDVLTKWTTCYTP